MMPLNINDKTMNSYKQLAIDVYMKILYIYDMSV